MSEEELKNDDSMEDILASIRETVEDEVEKTETSEVTSEDKLTDELLSESVDDSKPSDSDGDNIDANDKIEASEALAAMADTKEKIDAEKKEPEENSKSATADSQILTEDILELTDVVENAPDEELIDVDKFSTSGEMASADKDAVQKSRDSYNEAEASPSDSEEIDDIDVDSILSEIAEEGKDDTLPSEDEAANLLKNANNNEESEPEIKAEPEIQPETIVEEEVVEPEIPQSTIAAASEKVVEQAVSEIAQKVFLPTIPSAKGLQVSFPAEVLAEALRPLVTGWIEENLADIVERLVKEELSKLVEK